jgi:Raf kinase inhibitor-like YbhB/YbcL family protein
MLENLPDAVGHLLREQRAGLEKTVFWRLRLRAGQGAITLRSMAFVDHGPLPVPYTADGPGHSPPLQWTGVPPAATSLVLIVEDADSPTPQPLVHAIAVDLPAGDGQLPQGALEMASGNPPALGELKMGRNSFLQTGWLPPDPPPGHGVHRYVFQLFALVSGAGWSDSPGREAVTTLLAERAIASGCLIGTYVRNDTSVKAGHAAADQAALTDTGLTSAL